MMTGKKILIICDSDLSREPRVIRQILALKDSYQLSTVGAVPSGFAGVKHYSYIPEEARQPWHWRYRAPVRKVFSLLLRLYKKGSRFYPSHYFEKKYWVRSKEEIVERLGNEHFDVIIAHHWDSLPLACKLAKGKDTRLVFNAHDYYPKQFEDNKAWNKEVRPFVNYVMDRYLPKFDYIFSAWTKIHEDFRQQYGVPSIIINNATEFNDLKPQLRDETYNRYRIIHHGIANYNRKIEAMIDMMDHLDERFTLDFILVSPPRREYLDQLVERASGNKRIRFLDPVPTREIAKTINNYDIGLFLLPPNGFNPTYTLPNKLFEFIQGRLACLVSPNIEMKRLVEQHDLGWVSADFNPESLAAKISGLTPQELNRKKLNADKAAAMLSAEENYRKIREVLQQITDDSKTGAAARKEQRQSATVS